MGLPLKTRLPKSKNLTYAIVALPCAGLLILNILRISMLLRLKSILSAHADFPYTLDGNPRQLPLNVRNAVMTFNDTAHYGLHDVREWESLTPPGNGWVVLEPGPRAYAVTMYHQLHCLNSMRYDLTQSKIGKNATVAELGHAHHCYNYIRQGLQCGLDLTLEPTHGGTGGITHVCRDWVQVRAYMEQNFKKNKSYFD